MRYFLHLSYQGTNYNGWQRQSNVTSVQQVLEESLSQMLKEKIIIHGCGRTDSGVHASQYFAHVDIQREINFEFVKRINLVLPSDISIYDLIPVDKNKNAQYDALYRTYTYHLHTKKIPRKSEISAYYNLGQIDLEKIQTATSILRKTEDFRSLCKNPDLYKHTRCKIEFIEFIQNSDYEYFLTIKADRFLRGMIRYIIARLLDIGTGKLDLNEFTTTLSTQQEFGFKHQNQGYPQGLYLSKVEYSYLIRNTI